MDNNTGIEQFDLEFLNAPGIEQFDQKLRHAILSHIELNRQIYKIPPAEIKKINKEIGFLVKFQINEWDKKKEYIANNDVRPSEVPICFDIFNEETNKKKDYLFDEKFKIWMEHLYNIKTYNIFEKYKYDLFTARTTPLDHIQIRAEIDRLRIAVSQEN